jgi:hypothetical protein
MDIISLCVLIFVVGLIVWAVRQSPIDATFKTMIYVIAVVATVLYILRALGLWHGFRL